MLILTRRLGETICIGEHIRVTVAEIIDGKVKLGVDLPREMSLFRGEAYERIKSENARVVNSNTQEMKRAARLL